MERLHQKQLRTVQGKRGFIHVRHEGQGRIHRRSRENDGQGTAPRPQAQPKGLRGQVDQEAHSPLESLQDKSRHLVLQGSPVSILSGDARIVARHPDASHPVRKQEGELSGQRVEHEIPQMVQAGNGGSQFGFLLSII